MVDHVTEVAKPVETGHKVMPELRDARILKKAVRESIFTSPGSFLRTVEDVDTMSPDYWDKEIDTSTWVVIEKLDKVVGIAVARWPDKEMDRDIDGLSTRFIESVWIAPEFRGSCMGERVVYYLMEVEHKKYPGVDHFMLWVFESNKHAIRVYERMRFRCVGKHALEDGRIELSYEYRLPSLTDKRAIRRSRVNAAARRADLRRHGLTYRELGPDTL